MEQKKWARWEVVLWIYSTFYIAVFLLVFIIGIFAASAGDDSPPVPGIGIAIVVLTLPVLVFLILEGMRHLRTK